MKRLIAAGALSLAATPALAHHPLAGMEMTTFAHGLLSGLGHPVLGFDHLFFVIAVGILAAFTGHARTAPLAYLGAMGLGVLLTVSGVTLPLAEAAIAVSLLALGAVVLSGRAVSAGRAMSLFAGFGLFHGAAFGGAMASAEASATAAVLPGYLLGLIVVQYAIALLAGILAGRVADRADALQPRLAGAVVAGMGLFLTLEGIEGATFAALGWG